MSVVISEYGLLSLTHQSQSAVLSCMKCSAAFIAGCLARRMGLPLQRPELPDDFQGRILKTEFGVRVSAAKGLLCDLLVCRVTGDVLEILIIQSFMNTDLHCTTVRSLELVVSM